MERITKKTLEKYCEMLNRSNGHALEAYSRDENGKLRGNIGTYYIGGAYGGYSLNQIANEGGGVHMPLNSGHVPARELYERMRAYFMGIERAKAGEA